MNPLKRSLGSPLGWLLLSILVLRAVALPTSFEDEDDDDDDEGISFVKKSPVVKETFALKVKDPNQSGFIDLTQSNKCGKSAADIVPKEDTLNTTYQAKYGEFPWMTHISYKSQIIAVGTLIRLDIVLTTKDSICNIPMNDLQVYAGDWDLRSSQEKYSRLNRSVIYISARESIAILFLSTPFFNSPSIEPVCLPQPGAVFTEIDCKTIGWNQPSDADTSQSDILWFRRNAVLPREDCESQQDLLGNKTLDPNVFCAVDVSNEFSPLNRGAGLFCTYDLNSKHSILAGVALTSRDWRLDNRSALFANIPHYVEWIQTELSEDETSET